MSFSIESSSEIWHRHDLVILCNWRKLFTAVEIGVDRADFAQHFLREWRGHHYYGVDSYEPFPESNWDRQADYLMAVRRLEQFGDRARLVRLPSTEAAKLFKPGSVDFLYIDGAHDHFNVLNDLRGWWHTLSDQAILAGHDFDDTHPEVKQAVTQFAQEMGLTVYLTSVEGYGQEPQPSYYIYKSGMPGPDWRRC